MVLSKLRPSLLYLCPFKLFSGSPLFIGFNLNSDLVLKAYHNFVVTYCSHFLFPTTSKRNSQLHPGLLGLLLAHNYQTWITIYECSLALVPLTEIVPAPFLHLQIKLLF